MAVSPSPIVNSMLRGPTTPARKYSTPTWIMVMVMLVFMKSDLPRRSPSPPQSARPPDSPLFFSLTLKKRMTGSFHRLTSNYFLVFLFTFVIDFFHSILLYFLWYILPFGHSWSCSPTYNQKEGLRNISGLFPSSLVPRLTWMSQKVNFWMVNLRWCTRQLRWTRPCISGQRTILFWGTVRMFLMKCFPINPLPLNQPPASVYHWYFLSKKLRFSNEDVEETIQHLVCSDNGDWYRDYGK